MPATMAGPVRKPAAQQRTTRYHAPADTRSIGLRELLTKVERDVPSDRQMEMLASSAAAGGATVYVAGDLAVLRAPCVSIVGTREASEAGLLRATRLARELAAAGVVVTSGLARGVDTAALTSAMTHHGRVAAVIGTPLGKAYPAENAPLQERIWREHLLLSPFAEGEAVFRSNFPKRNRVMAVVSDATVIVEASDTSGTLHQAAECQRLGRWLFIMRSVAEDTSLTWPASFLGKPRTAVLECTEEVIAAVGR
jgi:DNA processing protein